MTSVQPYNIKNLPQNNADYFGNYARPYLPTTKASRQQSLFYGIVGNNYTSRTDTSTKVTKTKKAKRAKRKLRKNISKNPTMTNIPQPLAPKSTFWGRIGKWFARQYEGLNNFIEQPFTTTMNLFRSSKVKEEKITFASAATQSVGNIALKVAAMPILAPIAIVGLMYTSIKPLIQYFKQD